MEKNEFPIIFDFLSSEQEYIHEFLHSNNVVSSVDTFIDDSATMLSAYRHSSQFNPISFSNPFYRYYTFHFKFFVSLEKEIEYEYNVIKDIPNEGKIIFHENSMTHK